MVNNIRPRVYFFTGAGEMVDGVRDIRVSVSQLASIQIQERINELAGEAASEVRDDAFWEVIRSPAAFNGIPLPEKMPSDTKPRIEAAKPVKGPL